MRDEIMKIKELLAELTDPRVDWYYRAMAYRAYTLADNALEEIDIDADYMPLSLIKDFDILLALRDKAKTILISLL